MSYLIYALYLGNFLLNAANSAITPFFPQKAQQSFGVGESLIGIIFSVHPVGNFICTLLLGQVLSKGSSRKFVTILGVLTTAIGLLGFITVEYISSQWLFLTATIISRIILGIGQSLFCTPAYAYIPLLYSSTFEEKCGWMESWNGVGLMAGPLLGSLLFQYGGYLTPFLFFAGSCIFLIPVFMKMIPNDQQSATLVDKEKLTQNLLKEFKNSTQVENVVINYKKIFSDKHICLNYITIFLPSCGFLFLDPTMGIFFKEQYGLDELYVGLVFSVGTAVFLLSSPFANRILSKVTYYEVLLFGGSLITGISFIFLGPEEYTFLPKQLYITCIANGMTGIASIFIYVPALPQLYRLLVRIYPQESQEVLGDVASALYNTSYAVGEFLGPLIGGVLAQYFSFPRGASIFGVAIVTFSIIYAIFTELKHDRFEEIKSDDYPINLTPSTKSVNMNKIKTRQPIFPGLFTLSSPMSITVPKFYTPVLKSERDYSNGSLQYVLSRNVVRTKRQKSREAQERKKNSQKKSLVYNNKLKDQNQKLNENQNLGSGDENNAQQSEFQFEVNSDLGNSGGSYSESSAQVQMNKERVGSHLFKKVEGDSIITVSDVNDDQE